MATPEQIAEVAKHYLIACIWVDCPEGTHPRAPIATQRAAFDRCKAFIDAHLGLFNLAMDRAEVRYGSHPDAGSAEAAFGHDLYLTTAGHGTGFWDREELDADDLGDRLTDTCRAFGEPCPTFYRGWLYL